jgi:TP901-1 family phage major tail protein
MKLRKADSLIYETVAGLRANEIMFNARPVDVTHAQSVGRWRELLDQSGVRSVRISGNGLLQTQTADILLREIFFSGSECEWQIFIPNFARLEGTFILTQLNYAGTYDGEVNWEMEVQSAGEVASYAV